MCLSVRITKMMSRNCDQILEGSVTRVAIAGFLVIDPDSDVDMGIFTRNIFTIAG